jgi:hypothetical protein
MIPDFTAAFCVFDQERPVIWPVAIGAAAGAWTRAEAAHSDRPS